MRSKPKLYVMKKIVIASDSFKGSLSSKQVAQTVSESLQRIYKNCEIIALPIADGGEGLTEALIDASKGSWTACRALDPLGREIVANYGISQDGLTAIVEMAAASGLPLVEKEKRNPLLTTSYGTGQVIADALSRGCKHFLIGIGGSATNDAGVGMLQALCFEFYSKGRLLPMAGGASLALIDRISSENINPLIKQSRFTVACDVNNPLYGPSGAARVYAPQKGASPADVERLDEGLRNFGSLINTMGVEVQEIAGAGAAGGMGAGLAVFLNAELKRGIDLVLDYLCFDELIADADLIITGEGRMDEQTLMGKAPSGVLTRALNQGIPCIALAGRIDDEKILKGAGFEALLEVSPRSMPLDEAMKPETTQENISKVVANYFSNK